MSQKYKFTGETKIVEGVTVHRIVYLKSIVNGNFAVNEGDEGGFLEKEDNLRQDLDCLVLGDAVVLGDASVRFHAMVMDDALVIDKAVISGNAIVFNSAIIGGMSKVVHDAIVFGKAKIFGKSFIQEKSAVSGRAHLINSNLRNATVQDSARVDNSALIDTLVSSSAVIENSYLYGENIHIKGGAEINNVTIKEAKQVIITGFAVLNHVKIDSSLNVRISENAKLIGAKNKEIFICGQDIVVSDNSSIYSSAYERPSLDGKNIRMSGHSVLLGGITLYDNVKIEDFAEIINSQAFIRDFENLHLHGDSTIVITKAS